MHGRLRILGGGESIKIIKNKVQWTPTRGTPLRNGGEVPERNEKIVWHKVNRESRLRAINEHTTFFTNYYVGTLRLELTWCYDLGQA
jgi:hypothetical protein